MGWASGSEIAASLWEKVRKHVPEVSRKACARAVIEAFEDADCDTIGECFLLVKDADWEKRYYGD